MFTGRELAMAIAEQMYGWFIGLLCVAVAIAGLAFYAGYKLGNNRSVEIDCRECGGTGQVEYDGATPGLPKGVYVCPMCGGSKKLTLEPVK